MTKVHMFTHEEGINILHVFTMHQQYQSTYLLFQLMHTVIKSQECSKQLKFQQLLRHVSVHVGTIIRELFRA